MPSTTHKSIEGPLDLDSGFTPDLVSVIMPCYNSAELIEDAVNSVIAQDYRPIELLIVDDGSTDGSTEVLRALERRHPGILRCLHQPNQGPYPARNLGLSQARGELIAFLDADDYWADSFLSKLIAKLRDDEVDLAYCGWQNVGVEGGFGDPYVPPRYEEQDAVASFLNACPWPIHAAVLRRDLLARLGGFSVRFFTSMDFDLWLRTRTVTERIALVPEILAFYRWHDKGQISAVKSRQVRDAWQVRRDFIAAYPALVAHLDKASLQDKVDGFLLDNARRAYWNRDLSTARILFRLALGHGAFRMGDLRHLLPSLLPEKLYSALVGLADRRHAGS